MTGLHPDIEAWFHGGPKPSGHCLEHGTVMHGSETCPDCSPVEQASEADTTPEPVPVHPNQMGLFEQGEE